MTSFDVTMTKRQNTHISETGKIYDVIMTSFLKPKHLKLCMRPTFHKIVFAHIKFGLVRIKGSGVKRGADSPPFGLSEFLKSASDFKTHFAG